MIDAKSQRETSTSSFLSLEERIAKYGYSFVGVFGSKDHPNFVPFCYSVGRAQQDQPDFITSGHLAPHVSHGMISAAVEYLKKGGQLGVTETAAYGRVELREVTSTCIKEKYACSAYRLAQGHPVRIIQVLWSDENNVLPSEDGYDALKYPQEILG